MNIANLFNFVLRATIFGSVVGLIIFVLKLSLLKKLPAKWQYWLWSVMLLKLIFPQGPESSISVFNQIKFSGISSEAELLKIAERAVPIAENVQNSFDIAAYVWFAGFILALIWTAVSFAYMNYKIRRSSSPVSDKTIEMLNCCKARMGIKRNIGLKVQSHISSPSLSGLIRPVILINKNFEKSDNSHMEYTFIHELSHYKRKDIAMNYFLLILQCVHWFNPITWFIFSKIRRDTELATDEKTMLYITPSEHKNYGMALINTLSVQSGKTPALLGITEGLALVGGDRATRSDVASMVFNALDTPLMVQIGFGVNQEFAIADGKSNTGYRTPRTLLGDFSKKPADETSPATDEEIPQAPLFNGPEYTSRLIQIANLSKKGNIISFNNCFGNDKTTYIIDENTFVFMTNNTLPIEEIANDLFIQTWYKTDEADNIKLLKVQLIKEGAMMEN